MNIYQNNFDLIRLFAAAEVMVFHLLKIFGYKNELFVLIDTLFPGVPIFFFISGMLIFQSFDKNNNLRSYAISRILRIYPALYLCFAVTLISIVVLSDSNIFQNMRTLLIWVGCQLTMFQSWNPEMLRLYGMGVSNASLWTIPVEVLFYCLVPLVFFISKYTTRKVVVCILFGVSFAVYGYSEFYLLPIYKSEFILYKVLHLSPASISSWLWMFLCGAIAQMYIDDIIKIINGNFFIILILYIATSLFSIYLYSIDFIFNMRPFGLLNYMLLCALIVSAAYSAPHLAEKILKRNDISYGIYLFHWPVANALLVLGVSGGSAIFLNICITVFVAMISWLFVEKPDLALRKKYRPASG
jgi:peptidoglycan/LPS O-acetylase OafA/YrhL